MFGDSRSVFKLVYFHCVLKYVGKFIHSPNHNYFIKYHITFILSMRGSSKFCQRGSKFDNVFLVVEGREDPNIIINGPSSACQRNAI